MALSETDLSEDMTVYIDDQGKPRVVGNISLPEGYGSYKFDTELEMAYKKKGKIYNFYRMPYSAVPWPYVKR